MTDLARQYVEEQFKSNPLYAAPQVVARRRSYLGLEEELPTPSIPSEDLQERREQAKATLEAIRTGYWQRPLPELEGLLRSEKWEDFPELLPAAERWQQLVAVRKDFAQLANHPHCQQKLFTSLKEVVTLPPQKAGLQKERVLRSLAKGGQFSKLRRMVRTIEEEFPELYALESEWLEQVKALKRSSAKALRADRGSDDQSRVHDFEFAWWHWALLIYVILKIIQVTLD